MLGKCVINAFLRECMSWINEGNDLDNMTSKVILRMDFLIIGQAKPLVHRPSWYPGAQSFKLDECEM